MVAVEVADVVPVDVRVDVPVLDCDEVPVVVPLDVPVEVAVIVLHAPHRTGQRSEMAVFVPSAS